MSRTEWECQFRRGSKDRRSTRPVKTLPLICLGVLLTALALPSWSAAPTLEHFHPPGVAIGLTNLVRVTGKFEPWPPKVWMDALGIDFLAQTNKGEFQVIVRPDAIPGVRLIRLFNEEGTSAPRPFVIGAGPELLEAEPNDHFAKAQEIAALPQTLSGRLEKNGDVDSFAVALKAGEKLEARIDSFVLMSRLDAVLRLVTTNGQQLAWNHDFATLDPRLTWATDKEQTVVVQVFGFPYPATSNVHLTGGDGASYRLHLGLSAAKATPAPQFDLTVDPPPPVELPSATTNHIRAPGQLQRVRLHVTEAGWIAAEVRAESIGSPLDAWLRLDDKDGKQISRNDDANETRDPYLEWQATTNSDYTIVVGSLTRQAGDEERFELAIQRVEPDFKATAAASSLTMKPGTTNEFKVTVTRLRGFTNELQLLAKELPSGVTCEPVTVSGKSAEAKLVFVAQADAAAVRGPFGVQVRDLVSGSERPVPFLLAGSSTDNGVPGGYRVLLADRTETLWLTVLALEKPAAPAETAAK